MDLDLLAKEWELEDDEDIAKQLFQTKTHSSTLGHQSTAAPESHSAKPATSSLDSNSKQHEIHSSLTTKHFSSYDEGNKYDAMKERSQNDFARESKCGQDSKTILEPKHDHKGTQFTHLSKPQNRNLLRLTFNKYGSLIREIGNGANDKRGFDEADVNDLKILQPPSHQHSSTSAPSSHSKNHAAKDLSVIYRRAGSQYQRAHHAPAEVGYAASTMPGKSPGRQPKRLLHSQSSKESIQEIADDSRLPPRLGRDVQEIEDSEDELQVGLISWAREAVVVRLG